MKNSEPKDDDFSDIEDALMKLRPVEPSARFYESVEAAMSESKEDAVAFPHRGGFLNFISFRRIAASAALLAATAGLGIWGISVLPGNSPENGLETVSDTTSVLIAAGGSVPLLSGSSVKEPLQRKRRVQGNYKLVNVERRMNSVEPTEVVKTADGVLSRRVRYLYMDEYRWVDKETGSAFVELRPHEKIVSMEMPVY